MTPKGIGMWELVTPEYARELLNHNTNNYRPVNRDSVSKLARSMKDGLWQENGESVVLNEDGILVDGQHRLHAVIESGASVWMYIMKGIAVTCNVWDGGRTRTEMDHAHAAGLDTTLRMITLARYMIGAWDERILRGYIDRGKLYDYINSHNAELAAAISCASTGSTHHRGSGSLNRLYGHLLMYMFLRNGYNESKMRQFCAIYNGGVPDIGVDPTPALIVARQYSANQPKSTDPIGTHEAMANIGCAFEDFNANNHRRQRYTQGSTSTWTPERLEALWHEIRRKDGIE